MGHLEGAAHDLNVACAVEGVVVAPLLLAQQPALHVPAAQAVHALRGPHLHRLGELGIVDVHTDNVPERTKKKSVRFFWERQHSGL